MRPTKYAIEVCNRQEIFECEEDHLVLLAMEAVGKNAISVGCRKGGCGMCKVRVLKGAYHTLKMSRAHVSEKEQQEGFALACRLRPESALLIESDHFQPRNGQNS